MRQAKGAAVLGFLAHLVGDVGAGLAGLVFVEGGQDAVHELADGGVVDGLGGGDQRDATLAEIGHDDGVVEAVAGHAGELVDDDHVNVTRGSNSSQHLLEGDPLGHLGGGLAWLDELIDHSQAELVGLALARDPLGRDGDAFWVVVGVDLPSGGDAQVDDGTSARLG